MQKEIETLERVGIIERSISPWASPVVIVPKKSAPSEPPRRRMCIDYQRIHKLQPKVTKADGGKGCISLIPLPEIDELYAKLKGYKVFFSLDLRSGYYHISLKESAKPKSAFVLSSLGKYQFNRVPFGLVQAPAYFQKLINDVLKGCNFAMGYLYNIIIYSRSEKEHLEEIFTRLKAAGLKLKLEKCCFFKNHIQYLGHLISADGIQPLPEKLESIAKMPAPRNPKEVKQFLRLVGYYRKFIPRFADISRVLTHLTKKDMEFKWTPECENCFQILKEFLQQAPILQYPDPQKTGSSMVHPYYIEEELLMCYVDDNKQRFEVIVVPRDLSKVVLKLAHDDLDHNGSARTYMIIRRNYYWKGLRPDVVHYVKRCTMCRKYNSASPKYNKGTFQAPGAPMDFISMDLIGEFHPPSTHGNKYALTVICMLLGWTWCILIPDKTAPVVIQAYLKHVHHVFGPSRKILSDNGTEFSNKLFETVARELGVEHKIYSPPL